MQCHYSIRYFSVESIAEDLQQQQEDIEELDTKVDATIDTVVTIGDKVIEHDKEIGELGEGLERVEERVDDVEEDLGDTKIKVEEIDNKVCTYIVIEGLTRVVISYEIN